jgi:hypothetical protein
MIDYKVKMLIDSDAKVNTISPVKWKRMKNRNVECTSQTKIQQKNCFLVALILHWMWLECLRQMQLGEVNNYPQCSCICVSVGSTVVLRSIAMRGFLVIISAQV